MISHLLDNLPKASKTEKPFHGQNGWIGRNFERAFQIEIMIVRIIVEIAWHDKCLLI